MFDTQILRIYSVCELSEEDCATDWLVVFVLIPALSEAEKISEKQREPACWLKYDLYKLLRNCLE